MIVRLLERLTSKLADVVVPISESQRNRSVELGLYPRERSRLLGPGSSNGIPIEAIANARAPAVDGLERACFVIGVVGRLARDKGLEDLPEVLDEMESRCPNLRVLIVGEVDVTDPPNEAVRRFILRDPRVIYVGGVDEPYGYYHLFDVLLHLSRREGFGNVILEAAAAGIPTVAYRIPGVLDAVEHGRTGLLATPLDRRGIVAGLTQYASDRSLRVQHGIAAQARARRFSQAKVWHSLDKLYADLLNIADKGEPDTLGNTRRAHLAH